MRLRDRVAIVTGAGRGIGRAIALGLAREGAHIVAVSRTPSEIESTAAEVRAIGSDAIAVRADVTNPRDMDQMADASQRRFGRVDILVNNAGTFGPIGPLLENDRDRWIQAVMTNLVGPFLCTRSVLGGMIQRRYGKIINLSGGGAASARPNFTAYAASKAAVVRLTESLAREVEEYNIQVNAIAPGPVFTRLTEEVLAAGEAAGPEALADARQQKEQSVESATEEAVALAVFLASEASNAVSGRFISAMWDDWRSLASRAGQLAPSDYTLRRIHPNGVARR
jgi:3-oxoacyl-[acyl-carrier protein] reductase